MPTNPIDTVSAAAGGDLALAEFFAVKPQAISGFRKKGWLPLDRAKAAAERFGLPIRDLVRGDVREAMDKDAQQRMLSD
jgi:hypothetical protein